MAFIDKKRCTKCKEEKAFSEFRKCKRARFGLMDYCKICQDIASKESYEKNKEYRIELAKDWQAGNPTMSKSMKREWARKNREKTKNII